jgi:hypothetical protein
MLFIISGLSLGRLLLPLCILTKPQTNAIHTMPLICRRFKALSLKHMPEMPTAITTYNLDALHAKCIIHVSRYRARHRVKVCRPAAAGFEFGVGLVERSGACRAVVDAR